MLELREVFAANGPQYVMLGGLIIGFVFGYIVFRTNFCTMGAISDFMSFGDFRRFRAWILAGATAIVGTQLLVYTGVLPISETMYISGSLNWLGNILGGQLNPGGFAFMPHPYLTGKSQIPDVIFPGIHLFQFLSGNWLAIGNPRRQARQRGFIPSGKH